MRRSHPIKRGLVFWNLIIASHVVRLAVFSLSARGSANICWSKLKCFHFEYIYLFWTDKNDCGKYIIIGTNVINKWLLNRIFFATLFNFCVLFEGFGYLLQYFLCTCGETTSGNRKMRSFYRNFIRTSLTMNWSWNMSLEQDKTFFTRYKNIYHDKVSVASYYWLNVCAAV